MCVDEENQLKQYYTAKHPIFFPLIIGYDIIQMNKVDMNDMFVNNVFNRKI